MKRLSVAMALLAFVLAPLARGGTGAGNEFFHRLNRAFDFHMATPKAWPCDGCAVPETSERRAGKEEQEVWTLHSPKGSTWLRVTFIAGFPAEKEAELLAEIKRRHDGTEWTMFDRGGFIGYSSSAQGDRANAALEYYLVAKHQVIFLEWQKDGTDGDAALKLDAVKASIDRASEPPRINSIRTEKDEAYKVGDTACLLVEVDDLRAAFTAQSLKTLDLEGALQHWSFKRIEWVADKNWFRACYYVTSAFTATGLRVKVLSIDDDDSRTINCRASDGDAGQLNCWRYAGNYDRLPPVQIVRPSVAPVANAAPDLDGPEVRSLSFDQTKMLLTIDATDASGVYAAEIYNDDERILAYPDQVGKGQAVSLVPLVHGGWNTISKIVLYDVNGVPTLLRQKLKPEGKRRGKDDEAPETYEVVTWTCGTQPTELPVISFLKGVKL